MTWLRGYKVNNSYLRVIGVMGCSWYKIRVYVGLGLGFF